jgi:hypothetical protein
MTLPEDSLATERAAQSDPENQERPVISTQRARQGVTGHNVRYVLGFGLAAIIIAFAVIYIAYFA